MRRATLAKQYRIYAQHINLPHWREFSRPVCLHERIRYLCTGWYICHSQMSPLGCWGAGLRAFAKFRLVVAISGAVLDNRFDSCTNLFGRWEIDSWISPTLLPILLKSNRLFKVKKVSMSNIIYPSESSSHFHLRRRSLITGDALIAHANPMPIGAHLKGASLKAYTRLTADELAKEAAEFGSSDIDLLPRFLRNELPISLSAITARLRAHLRQRKRCG